MFQDSGIILSEKIFFRFSAQSESMYRNEIRKAETPPYLRSEKGDSPCSDHMERRLDLGCLIALRCESARRQSRSIIFKVKKIFNFFSKRVFSMFQDSGIILSETNFFRLSEQSESTYRNEIPKAETPSTCNQRRRTLPVRITWKGDWTSGVLLHCDARVPDASRGQ